MDQPQPNPKRQYGVNNVRPSNSQEHVQAVTTLRSGKEVQKPDMKKEKQSASLDQKETQVQCNEKTVVGEIEKGFAHPGFTVAPFPQRLTLSNQPNQNREIQDVLKEVKFNIPLLDAIKQAPSYAKLLKELCTIKRTMNVQKKAFVTKQVSTILKNNTPPKYKDPGCPMISCIIGNHQIEQALLDLGVSVNLLPYSVYEQLELGELKATQVTLQLDERSVETPRGIVEDVFVQIEKFYFPVDFFV